MNNTFQARLRLLVIGLVYLWLIAAAISATAACMTADDLKARIQEATKGFQDMTAVGTVTYKDKDALAKVDSSYTRLYEFKTANVSLKMPDKLRITGKLGMVKLEYIVNGGFKIVRSPTLRINKKQDYSSDPAKLQTAFDLGLVTPVLWSNRRIEVVEDPEADANGEIKLRLQWPKGSMVYTAWIDSKDFWLKRFEKLDDAGTLIVRMIYSNPQKIGGVIWMPLKVEMFAPDGTKAGASEYSDIKVNTGLADSLFQ